MTRNLATLPGRKASKGVRVPTTGSRFIAPPGFDRSVSRVLRIGGKNSRVLVYAVQENQIYIGLKDQHSYDGGTVFVHNWELGSRSPGHNEWMGYQGGINAAIRGQLIHAVRRTVLEAGQLHGMAFGSLALAMDLDRSLFSAEVPEIRQQFTKALMGALEVLGNPRDPLKVEALEKLEAAVDSMDSLGRRNPAAKMLQIWCGMHRVEDRLAIVRALEQFLRGRGVLLLLVRDRIMAMFRDLRFEARNTLKLLRDPKTERDVLVAAALRLDNASERFGTIALAPYGRHSLPHQVKDLSDGAKLIRAVQYRAAEAKIDRLDRSCTLILEHHLDVEDVLAMVSGLKETDAKSERHLVVGLRDAIINIHDRLEQNRSIDVGFDRRVVPDLIAHLGHAADMLDGRTPRIKNAYEYLCLASRCF